MDLVPTETAAQEYFQLERTCMSLVLHSIKTDVTTSFTAAKLILRLK